MYLLLQMSSCYSHRVEVQSMTPAEKARTHLRQLIAEREYPGIQYAVLDDDGVRFEYNGGWRDVAAHSPVTATTSFMSASMTKTVTALAVLQLVDRRLVELDEPLSNYSADHPYGNELTVRQLISHTAGVPNPMPLDWFHTPEKHERYDEGAELGRRLAKNPKLKSTPGSEYRYSNLDYWLLHKVIENAAGMPYEDYVRQNILEPLEIPETDLEFTIADSERRAVGYIKRWSFMRAMIGLMAPDFVKGESTGSWASFAPLYMNGPAYGGLLGNARGWAAFLADQLAEDSKVMSPAVRELYYATQRTADGEEIAMTLGWHKGSLGGHDYYYKAGGGPGYSCNIRVYPDLNLASVWMSNRMEVSESPIQELSDAIDSYFLN
jgi:CubicO group peptidase (beta-lactamase class C family)